MAATSAAEIVLPSNTLERDAAVTAVFRLDRQATGTGRLAVKWTDSLGRIVEERSLDVVLSDEQEVRFPIDGRRAVAMVNDLSAVLTLEAVNKKGAAERREEAASVRFVARPPAGWTDYAIIMWQPRSAEQFAALKKLGINTGQSNGRNTKLPEFLLRNDLRWYAENIATDYYAEYHRFRPDREPEWSFRQVKEMYRKDPASMEPFKRHPSLSDAAWRQRIRDRLADAARRLSPYRPLFYDLADESGIADLAGFWDFDFSDQSLEEMRVWLKERYGTLAALNRQWESHFETWAAVTPDTTNQAMKRKGDNFSAWADHKEWMDVSFARAIRMGVDAVRSVDPEAYAGIAGAQMPGWGGYDYARLSHALTAVEPYDIGNNIEIIRSLNPRLPFVTTAFARGPWEKHRLWYELLHGARGHIIWDEKNDLVTPEGAIGDRGREVSAQYNELRSGIGALLIQSERQADPIAIHYSQASMRTEWMLARRPEGDAWVNRTSATERKDSEFLRLRESYSKLLEDLGLQYNFVSYEQLERGELLKRGYRVLILPRSSSLSEAEAQNVREFGSRGGLVVADGEPGVFDEHSRRLARPALSEMVRMNALAYHQQRLLGTEGELHREMGRLLRQAGVAPAFAVLDGKDQAAVGVEAHRFLNGGVTLLGLLSNPQLRVDELGPPEFRSNGRFEKPRAIRVALPADLFVYDIRGARSLGKLRELKVTLDPYEPVIWALSAQPIPGLRVSAPRRASRGQLMNIGLSFDGVSPAATHVFHLDVLDPEKNPVLHYAANVIAPAGHGRHTVPLAHNDAAGSWTVRVRDLLSGQENSSQIEVF
jgi:hypothetical protein